MNFTVIFTTKTRLPADTVKKVITIGLFVLLLCHMLAHVIAGLGAWWQQEHDLSERLLVYRSVDSIVEFQIPLANKTDGSRIARTTESGFGYRGRYYNVVSLEVRSDTVYIAGLESGLRSFWQSDLLSFLNDHLAASPSADAGRKASQLLKLLLKEYSSNPAALLPAPLSSHCPMVRIANATMGFSTRAVPIQSPPPQSLS